MALQIYHTVDTYDLAGTDPIRTNKAGHVSHLLPSGLIEERYQIVAKVGSGDDLAVETNRIIRLKHLAQMYHSQVERSAPVWFQEASGNDISTRQAVVYDINITWLAQHGRTRLLDGRVHYGELVIVRGVEWESAVEQSQTETTLTLIGDQFELTDYYYKGMTGARVDSLLLDSLSATAWETVYDVWIGVREKGLGFSSFVALQECEDADNGTDAGNISETYYSGGAAKRVTFNSDPTMADRVRFQLGDMAGSNYHHFFGEYLVLLGYRHNQALTTFRAQLTGENVVTGPVVDLPTVSTLGPLIKELGYIRLPGQTLRDKYSDLDISNMSFSIAAERTTGTEYLYLDFIVLMPARRLLRLQATQLQDGRLYFHEHPEGSMVAYQAYTTDTVFRNMIEFEAQGFRLPADEAMVVIAANAGNNYGDISLTGRLILDWRQTFEKYHTN